MANEYWIASWEYNGAPKTGLTPTIEIIELPNTVSITGAVMTEISNLPGTYYYLHTTYDPTKEYVARADSIVTTVSQKYVYASNSDDLQISGKIPDNNFMGSAVKTPKDNAIDEILEDTSTTIPASLASIQADLDNPDQYKANVSDLATESNATANKTEILNDHTLMKQTATGTYDRETDSLEAIRNNQNGTDWTEAEKENIRDALGVDGTKTPATGGQLQIIIEYLIRIKGLTHENIHQDHTFVGGLHVSSEIYLYDSKANAETHDGVTGLEESYSLSINYSGTDPIGHTMVKN